MSTEICQAAYRNIMAAARQIAQRMTGKAHNPHAPNNATPKPKQPQHVWQKPGCAASIGETGIGVLGTGGEAVAIWFVGPEFLVVAAEGVAIDTSEAGAMGGAVAVADIAYGVGTALAAPVLLTGAGISGIATKCF